VSNRVLLNLLAVAWLLVGSSVAKATIYDVTLNVSVDNNPNYSITGSFLYDNSKLNDPSALYGLSNFNVSVVSPYGAFQANYVWSADSAFDYLGLGSGSSPNTPALMLIFSQHSNGNGTGLNNLNQAAINNQPLSLINDGPSDFIPGRSVVVPSIAALYGINYSGYGAGNWPATSNAFPTIYGDLLVTADVREPSTWAMLLIGFAAIGWLSWRRISSGSPRSRRQNDWRVDPRLN
jgi:hypothetical protein